jgi:hypothetical protein
VVVLSDVKLDHCANNKLSTLVLRKEAVLVEKKVSSKSVRIDETPCTLEGTYMAVQTVSDPVARAE